MIVVILGYSGSGKTTLSDGLLAKYDFLSKATGHTTRQPREGEVNGKHYHFVSEKEFDKNPYLLLKRQDGVKKYGVDCRKLNNAVIILDTKGLKELKSKRSDVIEIYLEVSVKELERRLHLRGDNLAEARQRIDSDQRQVIFESHNRSIIVSIGSRDEVLETASQFVLKMKEKMNYWQNREFRRVDPETSFVERLSKERSQIHQRYTE